MKPPERQLWRVLNASAITYLDLQLLFNDQPQMVGVVALDGIPVNENGNDEQRVVWKSHVADAARGSRGIHREGPPSRGARQPGDADGRHRAGRRKRSDAAAGYDRR